MPGTNATPSGEFDHTACPNVGSEENSSVYKCSRCGENIPLASDQEVERICQVIQGHLEQCILSESTRNLPASPPTPSLINPLDLLMPLQPRRTWSAEDERRRRLEEDPDAYDVGPHSVTCRGCHRPIRLNATGRYYAANWNKHKMGCKSAHGLEAGGVSSMEYKFTGRVAAFRVSNSATESSDRASHSPTSAPAERVGPLNSQAPTYPGASSTQAGHVARATNITAGRMSQSDSGTHDQWQYGTTRDRRYENNDPSGHVRYVANAGSYALHGEQKMVEIRSSPASSPVLVGPAASQAVPRVSSDPIRELRERDDEPYARISSTSSTGADSASRRNASSFRSATSRTSSYSAPRHAVQGLDDAGYENNMVAYGVGRYAGYGQQQRRGDPHSSPPLASHIPPAFNSPVTSARRPEKSSRPLSSEAGMAPVVFDTRSSIATSADRGHSSALQAYLSQDISSGRVSGPSSQSEGSPYQSYVGQVQPRDRVPESAWLNSPQLSSTRSIPRSPASSFSSPDSRQSSGLSPSGATPERYPQQYVPEDAHESRRLPSLGSITRNHPPSGDGRHSANHLAAQRIDGRASQLLQYPQIITDGPTGRASNNEYTLPPIRTVPRGTSPSISKRLLEDNATILQDRPSPNKYPIPVEDVLKKESSAFLSQSPVTPHQYPGFAPHTKLRTSPSVATTLNPVSVKHSANRSREAQGSSGSSSSDQPPVISDTINEQQISAARLHPVWKWEKRLARSQSSSSEREARDYRNLYNDANMETEER